MFNLSGSEVVFILLIALVVLGPDKLPEAIRRFGRLYSELRKMSSGFQSELRTALDEPARELRETADLARRAVMFPMDDDTSTNSAAAAEANGSAPSDDAAPGATATASPNESPNDPSVPSAMPSFMPKAATFLKGGAVAKGAMTAKQFLDHLANQAEAEAARSSRPAPAAGAPSNGEVHERASGEPQVQPATPRENGTA